jgi:hypothetical protein
MYRFLICFFVFALGLNTFAAEKFDTARCPRLQEFGILCDFTENTGPREPNSSSIDATGKIHIYGDDGLEPWYTRGFEPNYLKEVFAADRSFLGADNPAYRIQAGGALCETLRTVGLMCDFITRGGLSNFLTVNSKGLFPAAGKTNPYVLDDDGSIREDHTNGPDDVYIGTAVQNRMLVEAIRRNVHLFRDGDLMATDVRENWK